MMNSTLAKGYINLLYKTVSTLLIICLASACGINDSDSNTRPSGSVSFSIELQKDYGRSSTQWERSLSAVSDVCSYIGIQTIIAEVYDENDVLLATGGPWLCGFQAGTIDAVPTGKNRKLFILCKNAEDEVVYSGIQTGIEILPGKTSKLGKINIKSLSLSYKVVNSEPQVSTKGVIFSWNEIDTATSYRIIISTNGNLSPAIVDHVTANTYYEATDLKRSVTYFWQVTPIYGNGNKGSGSDIGKVVITPPPSPEDVDDDHDGFTENMGDCNDQDPTIYPDAYEIECDGIDQDCIGGDMCTIVYVDPAGDVCNDGKSWGHAVPTLTKAIEIAEKDNSIWVKQGVYSDSLVVTRPINIYGGFSGEEKLQEERDPVNHHTVIDCGYTDSRCITTTSDMAIDGFHIQNGVANDGNGGGGILIKGDNDLTISADIRDCTFTNNMTDNFSQGGAVYVSHGVINVLNCRFMDNRATSGGAIAADSTDLVIENCRFDNNISIKGFGGALLGSNSVLIVNNSYFNWNQGALYGGGISVLSSSSLILNSIFMGNTAIAKGGGAFVKSGDVIITNCTFSQNTAGCKGGAVAGTDMAASYISNSILYYDTLPEIYAVCGYPTVSYSNIQMVSPISGEGNISQDPGFVDPESGNLHLLPNSPCIDAGDNPVDMLPDTDIDGDPRIVNDWIDIGADEAD